MRSDERGGPIQRPLSLWGQSARPDETDNVTRSDVRDMML